MIVPGEGWRYRETLEDNGLFQDQVLEHVVTGHAAFRRVFGPQFTADKAAAAAVRGQLEAIAPSRLVPLPVIYSAETIEKCLAVMHELVDGPRLDRLAAQAPVAAPARWAAASLRVVRFARELADARFSIEYLELADLADARGVLRAVRYCPLGTASPDEIDASPMLRRLAKANPTGVVYQPAGVDEAATLRHLADLVLQLATGRPGETIDQAARRHRRNTVETSETTRKSTYGVEGPIDRFVTRLANPAGPEGIRSLDALELALRSMASGGGISSAPRATGPSALAPSPEELAADPHDFERTAVRVARNPSLEIPFVPKDAAPGEVEEDRQFLYPAKAANGTRDESGKPAGPSTLELSQAERARAARGRATRRWSMPLAITAAVLLLLGVLAYLGLNYINWEGPNQQPVAAFTASHEEIPAYAILTLDASTSYDPDPGDELRYDWRVLDLERHMRRFSTGDSSTAQTTELQFFKPGTYTIRLEVFDGQLMSEAAEKTIVVTEQLQ